MSNDFVHLHVHSEYSLLDGLGRIKNLVKEAKRLGQPALALTDHGVMHGAIEFFRACKDQGIRPLIGVEAYQTQYGRPMGGRDPQLDKENYHLLLLAKNMTGYRNMLKIASHAQLDGYYYRPRIDHEFLARHAEGIICTTGCLGAEVPQLLNQGKEREAYDRLGWYVDVFGRENFFIELQEHSISELVTVNKTLVPWAEKFGLQLVATNDVHYVREEDGGPHDVLLCVQTGVQISQQNRMRMSDGSYFLKSRAQMEDTFRPFIDLPASAFDHTLRIAEMCEVDLEDPTYHLPDLPIPEGFTYETYLRRLTEDGLVRLYGEHAEDREVQERKERELKTIHEMGFDIYYLIVADLCNFARRSNIWWNVRGSGAGSLVAYCVGITGIDPLKNNLIFERFLNPGRVTMPDFDLDFPDDQREAMIRYTVEKFGESQVAQIATFNRMKAKAAVRDVGRAQGIELPLVDKIAKLIPGIPGKPVTIQDCLTEGHEFYSQELVELYRKEQWVKELLETAMKLEGVARNPGIHAAAVIVADRELEHYTPLMRGSKSTVTSTIAQYEFPILESIGLLKVDFLGLSTLSVMREAARLIRERHGIEYRLDNIPYEGEAAKEAFTLLSSGEVSGVFQVESAGMRRTLIEMKPTTFEHIVAMISLYRPGPMEYIPTFIQRLHGEEQVQFKHPKLEPILNETYGICVYQEQIIQILSSLAGYTPGEADLVRRAIGKKKASEIEKHKKIFIAGCEKNGIDPDLAAEIYADIEFFARYGFNKCLPGDVEVVDAASGRLVRVEDLHRNPQLLRSTVTCDTQTLKLQAGAVSAVMDNGVKPVYRLTTALGRRIEATDNHPFYTFNGWRLLAELRPGDQIATPRRIPVEGSVEWPDYQVIALGRQLAEAGSPDAALPAEVFTLTNRQIGLLLDQFWGADASGGSRDQLTWVVASQRLAQQLQHLLLRLGVVAQIAPVAGVYALSSIDDQQNFVGHACSVTAPLFAEVGSCHAASVTYANAVRLDMGFSEERNRVSQRNSVSAVALDLMPLQDNDVYWDRIASIEYVGEKRTYDLEVPGTHNFVANDILVHNSHAADYAVITVQTAWLKAHYPVEYMAAQLLVERDKTEKVINFVSECRRMGVDVLAPDVNYSGLDFEIQVRPPETPQLAQRDPSLGYPFPVPEGSAIRFGMAAIKNVGEGPVEAILAARAEGGRFRSLEEFCDRVDLRKVGKRPLECLIKAGALDRFGNRAQLLAVLDLMVAQSASVHDARDAGQLSMFDLLASANGGDGEGGAHVTPIKLPDLEEVKGKEKLTWEKELLGVYSISHPLLQMDVDLQKVVSCSCAELDERYDGKGVTLAGLIAGVRTINTKKGDQMAFVQLEDLQGSCEAVFFPKTYAEFKDKLVVDSVVIVKGKAQTREGQTSLLAEVVLTHFDKIVAVGEEPARYQPGLALPVPTLNGMALDGPGGYAGGANGGMDGSMNGGSKGGRNGGSYGGSSRDMSGPLSSDGWDDFGPGAVGYDTFYAPGEENPFRNDIPDWMNDGSTPPPLPVAAPPAVSTPSADAGDDAGEGDEASASEPPAPLTPEIPPVDALPLPVVTPVASDVLAVAPRRGAAPAAQGQGPQAAGETPPEPESQPAPSPARQPKQEPPAAQPEPRRAESSPAAVGAAADAPSPGDQPPAAPAARPSGGRRLIITFRRTGDIERDKYRLREIYEMVCDRRGRDSFIIRIESGGHIAELAFPNDACNITKRLETDLKRLKLEVVVE